MTLFDTDKTNIDRGSPSPNSPDQIMDGANKNHGTSSVQPVTNATSTKGFLQTKNGRLIANDGNNNIGLFGFDSTGAMAVKVAKTGYDADTATNDQLVFNSGQDVFKIVSSNTATLAYGSGDTINHVTVTHNLGYIPAVMAFLTSSPLGGEFYFPLPSSPYYARSGGFIVFNAYNYFTVDSSVLKIYVATGTSSASYGGNWVFKYYLLQETAN